MANKKTNPAEVLKYFNDIKQARKGAMMNNYKSGGASDADCTTVMVNGKPKKRCKKKFGKRGGGGKVLKAIASIGAGIAAGFAGKKILKNFKDNGGF